mgnify:CR=1 FL=1
MTNQKEQEDSEIVKGINRERDIAIIKLKRETPYTHKEFESANITPHQILENFSLSQLQWQEIDYNDIAAQRYNYLNIPLLLGTIPYLSPKQLNIDPATYSDLVTEAYRLLSSMGDELKDEVAKIEAKAKRDIELLKKKYLEQSNKQVNPSNRK